MPHPADRFPPTGMDGGPAGALGALLRRYRVAAGLSQEALAERAGLSVRGLRDLERSRRALPRRDTVELLAAALELSARERANFVAVARGHPDRPAAEPASTSSSPGRCAWPPLVPLIGRRRALAAIERHLAGEGPPPLLLAGEPGIGKSRLLREAGGLAVARQFTVLAGGAHGGGQEPYAPLLDALQRYLRWRDPPALRADLQGCACCPSSPTAPSPRCPWGPTLCRRSSSGG